MTTNDHTPGPWYCPGINSKYGVSDWKQANITTGSEYAPIIATVHTEASTYLGEIDHDTMLANARLIAACPDLLYELEQACLSLDELAKEYIEGIGHNATARGVREQTRRARAAIEKARKEG